MPEHGAEVKNAPARILLADDDDARREVVLHAIAAGGFETVGARTEFETFERLRTEMFDAVVCCVDGEHELADAVVDWIGRCAPSMRIVALGRSEALAHRFEALGVRVVNDANDHAALVEVLGGLGIRRGFFGNSIEVELFDYVQMVALTGRDKLIEVDTPAGLGRIWFEHGDIVHAEFDQFRGELAFYKMLAAGRGTFREAVSSVPPKRTVVRSSTHLLMEAARQTDEGTLGQSIVVTDEDEETSFHDLMDDAETGELVVGVESAAADEPASDSATGPDSSGDFVALVNEAIELEGVEPSDLGPADSMMGSLAELGVGGESSGGREGDDGQAPVAGGHAVFEDPETRAAMLDQFWQFEGINGVAIISSTGKVLAEDMRNNSSLVTLAGFYMRGAARIARTLGYNVFDGIVARSVQGQQMVMVSMGAASAVLSVEPGADPEAVRDAVMGVE